MTTPRRGGKQPLDTFVTDLCLPSGFALRSWEPDSTSDSADEGLSAIEWLKVHRPRKQNFWPALVLALVAQAEELLAAEKVDSLADVFASNPEDKSTPGNPVNTLNFTRSDGAATVKLRPIYNKVVSVIRYTMLREHPEAPGHATQSWPAYRDFIRMVYAMSPGERSLLAVWVWECVVIPLPEMRIAQVRDRVVRPFEKVLRDMPTSVPRVRGGAILQGLTYGYLRADSPNLILESHKVNTGSSRAGMLGDVDGFRGSEPELAAEVKDLALDIASVEDQLGGFLEDIAAAPNATAVVVCRSITDDARELVEKRNVTVLTIEELSRTVSVWDLPKQQEALRGVDYYLGRIQKDSRAVEFVRNWLVEHELDGGFSVGPDGGKAEEGSQEAATESK